MRERIQIKEKSSGDMRARGVGWEWSGAEWSVEERKKAERGGGWGCGSYANERDLRELSRSKRSKVILHNDG